MLASYTAEVKDTEVKDTEVKDTALVRTRHTGFQRTLARRCSSGTLYERAGKPQLARRYYQNLVNLWAKRIRSSTPRWRTLADASRA